MRNIQTHVSSVLRVTDLSMAAAMSVVVIGNPAMKEPSPLLRLLTPGL